MKKQPETLHKFKVRNKWVMPYATFEVFKWHNDNKQWNEWRAEDRDYYLTHTCPPVKLLDEINFVIYMQYVALKQWKHVLSYAKRKGIKIICDMPFYVGFDGVECWLNRDQFSIGPDNKLFEVGGVGPDAFSDVGQLWGTPIFDFAKMEKDNYTFLIHRISYLASTCDLLRLDHFRAWDTYCVIPASDENAKRGEWWIGPRTKFFDILFAKYPKINLIAEDLGILFDSVHELRNHYKLPGMFITEFTILDEHAKSNENTIVYPGTHDNVPIEGWVKTLSKHDKKAIKKKLGNPEDLPGALLDYTRDLPSKITVFSMQDLLRLNEKATMNRPGTVGSPNWEWKLKDNSYMNEIKVDIKA